MTSTPELQIALLALAGSVAAAAFFHYRIRRRFFLALLAGLAAGAIVCGFTLMLAFVALAIGGLDTPGPWFSGAWLILAAVTLFWWMETRRTA